MADQGTVFVTGGTGMVGRNLVEALHEAGRFEVVAPGRSELDLTDASAVEAFIESVRPDVIVHCAGRVGGIQANIAEPSRFLADNFTMGVNVLQAATRLEVPKLINLASTCVYPREAPNPLKESAILTGPLEPTNEGYALAKIAVMRLGEYLNREQGQDRIKTLIPCNLFGHHDSFDPAKSHLVPAILVKLHEARERGLDRVEIWGTGEARREFMFAGDLADAIIRAIDKFDALPALMNIGVGEDHTVNEYYRAAAQIVGWKGAFVHDASRPVGMLRKLCSTKRQQEWGWSPAHSLKEGLAKTYAHYVEGLDLEGIAA